MRTYVEIERHGGIETRGIDAATEDETEEFILRWANTYGVVHVLDERGKRVRTITPGEAAERLKG